MAIFSTGVRYSSEMITKAVCSFVVTETTRRVYQLRVKARLRLDKEIDSEPSSLFKPTEHDQAQEHAENPKNRIAKPVVVLGNRHVHAVNPHQKS